MARPSRIGSTSQSEELESVTDPVRRKQRLEAGVVPLDDLRRAARAAGAAHFAALRTEVKAALVAWVGMSELLDARAEAEAPPTSRVRDILQAILDVVNQFAPPERDEPAEEASTVTEPEEMAGAATNGVAGAASAVAARAVTREDMLKELGRIADYFRRTEPHSPLAYTLEEAVRRGRLHLAGIAGGGRAR